MSRWIEQKNGKVVETIAHMDECYWLWNGMCCNDKSAAFAEHGDCEFCPHFTEEDGIVME